MTLGDNVQLNVLILVVVDDSLVPHKFAVKVEAEKVLILVVVDDSLVQMYYLLRHIHQQVLILVVVDDSLVQMLRSMSLEHAMCLNPCCSGR